MRCLLLSDQDQLGQAVTRLDTGHWDLVNYNVTMGYKINLHKHINLDFKQTFLSTPVFRKIQDLPCYYVKRRLAF